MEYKGTAEEYHYDPSEVFKNAKKIKDMHTNIIRKLAVERNWDYREDPIEETGGFSLFPKQYGYVTCARDGNEYVLENNEVVVILLYSPKDSTAGIKYDAVFFHWLTDRSYCHVFVCPLYSPPKDTSGYYEGSSISWRMRDGNVYCILSDSYADSADIQDHDHFSVDAGCRYDPKKRELTYYIP